MKEKKVKLVFVPNEFAMQSVSFILVTKWDILHLEILREYVLIPLKISNSYSRWTKIFEFLNIRSYLVIINERNLTSEAYPSNVACHQVCHLCLETVDNTSNIDVYINTEQMCINSMLRNIYSVL